MSEKTKAIAPIVLGEEPLRNLSSGAELFAGIGGNFSSVSEIICELVDDPISNILHNQDNPDVSKEITICFEDRGTRVGIMVKDGGSGIQNIHNALTIAGRAAPDGPLNAHGFGLKHAFSSLACGDKQDWWLESRTKENLLNNTYCRVKGPFRTGTSKEDKPMMILHCEGCGHVGDHTGTVIYTSCSQSVFKTAKPNRKYTNVTFSALVSYIVEHLRFTYAEILASGKIILKVIATDLSGNETTETLMPLLPNWKEGMVQEQNNIECNLGGGTLLADFRYGQIEPSEENTFYFKGNQASSGVQVSFNGRVITNRLYSAVYGEEIHNSQNRFLAQIDLKTDNLEALPRTKNTKTALSEGDFRYAALLKLISTYITAPEKDLEKLEDKLMRLLVEQERNDSSTFRADREEVVFRSAGVKAYIDLYVVKKDGQVIIYEGKAHASKVRDVGQVLLYILGCIYDGKPANRAVLIASRHSGEVVSLIPAANELLAALGIQCTIGLDTWGNRGIAVPA